MDNNLVCEHGRPARHLDVERPNDPRLIWAEGCEDCWIELDGELTVAELTPPEE